MSHFKGMIVLSYIMLNLLIASIPLMILVFCKALIPFNPVQRGTYYLMTRLYGIATWIDDLLFWNFLGTELEIRGTIDKSKEETHLIIANHRSWTDILILQSIFNDKTPVLKFLIKKALRYVPFVGWICWAYEYPFIPLKLENGHPVGQSHAKEKLKQDLTKLKHSPATIVNFAEGTRFTNIKWQKQNSPYSYLLKPKTGGFKIILDEFGNLIHSIYDVTIVYDSLNHTFWDFLCGNCKKIIVVLQKIPLDDASFPPEPYEKEALQQWINKQWQQKDHIIQNVLNES
ncbi:MAG: 1-acyl-sn-glycerol-3-phosphate acyltransferase [SAR324 cluster bacterium]|nr:1-acyl-sn-glycerol-3-phosphate acyltransferase [SAR324 cluster bacterium]